MATDREPKRTPLWQTLALTAGLAIGAGGVLHFATQPAGRPARPTVVFSAHNFLAHGEGAKNPEIMLRLVGLESMRQKIENEFYKEALSNQILLEAYAAIRARTLPADYREALLDELEPTYRALSSDKTRLTTRIGIAETVQTGVDATNNSIGTSIPRPNTLDSRGQLSTLNYVLEYPEQLLRAGGRLRAVAPREQAEIDRKMAEQLAMNSQLLETYATIDKIESMTAGGPLTIVGEEYLLDALRKASTNPNDYGAFYNTVNAGRTTQTEIIGAVRLTNGKDSLDIAISTPAFMVQVLPAIFKNAVEYKPASHQEALQLNEAAKAAFEAVTPSSPSR